MAVTHRSCSKAPSFKILALALSSTTSAACAEPSVFPTGATIHDPMRAYYSRALVTGGDNVSCPVEAGR
jgi:hypothetical protein